VLQHLNAEGTLRHLPVLVVSGLDSTREVVRCIEFGADDFLPRPINMTLLRARVNASLEKKRLREREFSQFFPKEIARAMSQAGHEAANDVLLETRGLRQYPPHTSANAPPTPYYVRSQGTQYKSYLKHTSEKLGKQWYVRREAYSVKIGNRASYAKWVHGEEQARFMAPKGWKKLYETAKEKRKDIERVYQEWTDYTIKRLGL
jgi:hypothetical protein